MRRGIFGVVPIAAVAAVAAWVIVSCMEPTEIDVQLKTNFACANVDAVLMVGGPEITTKTEPPYTATASTCKAPDSLGHLYVVPSGKAGPVYVRVVAGVLGTKANECVDPNHAPTAKCIEARRSIGFVKHRRLDLPITLDEACINKMCPSGTTCERGECVSVCTNDCADAGGMDGGVIDDAGMDANEGGREGGASAIAQILAGGFENACAYATNGKLYCWGDNSAYQLGTKKMFMNDAVPLNMPSLMGVTEIAVGNHFICATDSKTVQCIGSDSSGQLGDGKTGTMSQFAVTAFTGAKLGSLTAGDAFACVSEQANGGATYCWGYDGTKNDYSMPAQLVSDPGIATVAAGSVHACGLTSLATDVHCWGLNAHGQLAENPSQVSQENTPYKSASGTKITAVYAGGHHSGFTMGGGMLRYTHVWGDNAFGEIDPANPSAVVFQPFSIGAVDDLAFGANHVCRIQLGDVACRGNGLAGQVNGTSGQFKLWQKVMSATQKVVAGTSATCALSNGDVWCWGAAPIGPMQVMPTKVYLAP